MGETAAVPKSEAPRCPAPRIRYREALARDAGDQAEIFHHAVMQGAAAHYTRPQRDAWVSALPREACAWAARQALYTTLVAECDGRCVGFLELEPLAGRIVTLYVWPSLARRGIGSTLLIHAERLLIERGVSRASIEASLMLAVGLERRGWRDLGHEYVERNGERLSRHRLEKSLVALQT
ncbi:MULTISPECIES: GNAT family N-acetyltransferase [Halomonas]|uniref:GNAT family N-acetyltransferase n=2 Tax=Halomonas TaxID=2745 RepID=A0A7X5ALR7_9GAMM|nr:MULTISPECIES: GNAT family N-acetyltransferase [Halomonas]MDR5900805.1 GNAT family N-acetyltransferase [Halomonas icarae]NAW13727.1 GNAT family N-acetyltransferase [Halomonas icarae]TDB00414.1 GNAT family N-acetyltransferase [Halomonas marinisediminis]